MFRIKFFNVLSRYFIFQSLRIMYTLIYEVQGNGSSLQLYINMFTITHALHEEAEQKIFNLLFQFILTFIYSCLDWNQGCTKGLKITVYYINTSNLGNSISYSTLSTVGVFSKMSKQIFLFQKSLKFCGLIGYHLTELHKKQIKITGHREKHQVNIEQRKLRNTHIIIETDFCPYLFPTERMSSKF